MCVIAGSRVCCSCLLAEKHPPSCIVQHLGHRLLLRTLGTTGGTLLRRVDTRLEAAWLAARRSTLCYCKDPSDSPPARQLARFTAAVVLHRAIVSRRDFQLLIFRQCPHQLVRPLSLSHGHIAPTATPTSEAWSTPTTPSTGHAHVPTRFRQS